MAHIAVWREVEIQHGARLVRLQMHGGAVEEGMVAAGHRIEGRAMQLAPGHGRTDGENRRIVTGMEAEKTQLLVPRGAARDRRGRGALRHCTRPHASSRGQYR